MASKGVDYYGFRSTDGAFTLHFTHPADGKAKTTVINSVGSITHDNVQVDDHDLAKNESAGRFSFAVTLPSGEVFTRYADINPNTGHLDESDMRDPWKTPSVLIGDYLVSYGFFDASTGLFGLGLTSQDQCYVYVSQNYSAWMGSLRKNDPRLLDTPFNHFVLPGAHDAGMYDATAIHQITNDATGLATSVEQYIQRVPVVGSLLEEMVRGVVTLTAVQGARILINFAFTQKDTVGRMLDLGIRYFDFRPGTCATGLKEVCPGIYHQHMFVPGVAYDVFLRELLTWLAAHPTEVVVLALGSAGFAEKSMEPSTDELERCLTDAQAATGTTDLLVGDKHHLTQTYGQLLAANRRLLLLNLDMPDYHPATKYDSYDSPTSANGQEGLYITTSADDIIKALNKMKPEKQVDDDYTVFQLQGTVQGTFAGVEGSVLGLTAATAPLLSIKPSFDRSTYAWLAANLGRFATDKLTVVLNNFADNALVYKAFQQTQARIGH